MEGSGSLATILWVLLLAIVSVVTVSRPTKAFRGHHLPLLTNELVYRLQNEHEHLSRHRHLAGRIESQNYRIQKRQNCTHNECASYLRSPQKIKLTSLQRREVERERSFITQLKCLENFERADPQILRREIVQLTPGQKTDILTYYRSYFQSAVSLPNIPKRSKRGLRLCPRQQTWDDLYLALTDDDELIQVVQFPETDDRQWYLNERCAQPTCNQVANCICKQTYRLVRALVIRYEGNEDDRVAEKYIKVYCCNAELI
ncbi:uncharacterized protein [Amphiura filiformis]|uniref:uncharacterized protein n=1 Tax=Amphiura filiformis TaxID=82378 RepID=UPI003B2109E5